ncbi:DNA-binding Lrp family transcriptional regulator [Amycolatopsis lexingtonensis]|uniref:DNA-binding Lrp family transcriptional regulator n=2 Tax=Amycolatopsis lexingtonensis TaxID=218822 RepID=A0ABR9HU72_9PSEU|nr:Lrp/AsnC family transcriptional regulator [Amycolatopsis lexingtonensis]MBE1494466.1 DNA-binding Lrp family transcriptional regulator [Amycolatopsis lexingtonensis]
MPVPSAPPEPARPSASDLALVEALQRDPRAPWTRIAAAVGTDATTAARRWDRLQAAGLAWLTAYVTAPTTTVGYVDVACRPDALAALTQELCGWPAVFSVERTTSRFGLFLSLAARDLDALDALVTGRIGALPGVLEVRFAVATRVYREGSGWLVNALAPEQRAVLDDTAEQARLVVPQQWNDRDLRALVESLGEDGRRSYAELARDCRMSESAVRRALARMVRNHELDFRCDLAHVPAGWPVIAGYRLDVAATDLDRAGAAIAQLPETRLSAAVVGEGNLVVSAWLREPAGCTAYESALAAAAPGARVVDRAITLRMPKRMGRLLGPRGLGGTHQAIIPAR